MTIKLCRVSKGRMERRVELKRRIEEKRRGERLKFMIKKTEYRDDVWQSNISNWLFIYLNVCLSMSLLIFSGKYYVNTI